MQVKENEIILQVLFPTPSEEVKEVYRRFVAEFTQTGLFVPDTELLLFLLLFLLLLLSGWLLLLLSKDARINFLHSLFRFVNYYL